MLIDSLSADYPKRELFDVFGLPCSTYYSRQRAKHRGDTERQRLTGKVIAIHQASGQAAGSRTITGQLRQQGETIGRYKVRSLMREAGLSSRQPGQHRYKPAAKPPGIADNHLARQFAVERPNQVWCGDVTYIWSGKQWLYLALVIDLYARRVIGWPIHRVPIQH